MVRPRRVNRLEVLSDGSVKVHLFNGTYTLVDAVDADLVESSWGVNDGGYIVRTAHTGNSHKIIRLHRVIMSRVLRRDLQKHEVVDHINRVTLDNRRSNLRLVTQQQNSVNRKAKKTITGFKGIKLLSSNRKRRYAVDLRVNYERIYPHLYFETPEEAANMYDQWASQIHGEHAYLNFEYV